MKRILLFSVLFAPSAFAALQLPVNRSTKELTVPLELIIKQTESYITANKPVAASTLITVVEDKFARVNGQLDVATNERIARYIEQMKKMIQLQKNFQLRTFGKLLEVNEAT